MLKGGASTISAQPDRVPFENSVHEIDGAGFQIHAKHRDLIIEHEGLTASGSSVVVQ